MTVLAHNFSVQVHTFGKPEAAPFLMLHGFLGSGEDWSALAETLSSDCFCIAPDIPGHGATQPQSAFAEYTMENVARVIIACLDALTSQKAILCGYSMGARLALYLALSYPDRFQSVCILSGTAGLRTEEERLARRKHDETLAVRLDTEPFSEFLTFWYNQALFASFRSHPTFSQIVSKRSSASPHEAAKSLRGMGTGSQPNLWGELPQNTLPITFAAGEFDAKFVALARELHDFTPHSRLLCIPGAGHVLHHEARETVIRELKTLHS
ncbi:MAG: 2-succinyl-6-hydroxy-2,4-cyclohexadiene-1-carboxylate synthase [Candidatus Kapabacteria bacterium]|jgi:2-succinyl-6-hydroxy-2,4-cyclohexadiene-1-carboxylate synthase|nr:2-succinyl-6-hydroxy-2,4-cyclohexadiene-1-carboxylate synthase [Candidatus Kapabacteria bacterium]